MRVLITGASGLVGSALREHCTAVGDEVFAYDHASLDIGNREFVDMRVAAASPDTVINCAAWTDVDGCENDPQRASRVNAVGPENLARASRKAGAGFVTISTDYVFDGTKDGFYTQEDIPSPLSVYGKTKLEGERRVQTEYDRSIVVRTGFLFGLRGKNFLSRVVDLAQRGHAIAAICDAKGTPTYARDLASRLRDLAVRNWPGIFHVVNAGEGATYEEFARTALRLAKLDDSKLNVVSSASLRRPAPRPANSKLQCLLTPAIGLKPLPSWQEGLSRFIDESARESFASRV